MNSTTLKELTDGLEERQRWANIRDALEAALAALRHVREHEMWIDQNRVIKPTLAKVEEALRTFPR